MHTFDICLPAEALAKAGYLIFDIVVIDATIPIAINIWKVGKKFKVLTA